MTVDDIIETAKLNPQSAMRLMIENIEGTTTLEINDATNPFIKLLETSLSGLNAVLLEHASQIRPLFPELALEPEDLYNHMTTEEEKGSFAIPSKVGIFLMVSVSDIKKYGIYDTETKVYTIVIPKFSEVRVSDVSLLLQNDISIKLGETTVFVEELGDDNTAYTEGNIPSYISKDVANEDWVTFELELEQLKRYQVNYNITSKTKFAVELTLEDQYVSSNAYAKMDDGTLVPLEVTNSTSVYDHSKFTIRAKPIGDKVVYEIPTFYTLELTQGFELIIETFTTKGAVLIPLYKFTPSDFSIVVPSNFDRAESSGVNKVNIMVFSKGVLDGGRDIKSFEELREEVIFNSTGMRDLPLTEKSLTAFAANRGFTVSLVEDVITSRSFIATRDVIGSYENVNVMSYVDIMHGTASFYQPEISQNTIDFKDSTVLIKSNTVFKNNNGMLTPISQTEKEAIESATYSNAQIMLSTSEYLYTPFYYVLEKFNDIVETRVYDLDKPGIEKAVILSKNTYFVESVNINQYGIFKTSTGYDFFLKLYGNKEFEDLNKDDVKIQLGFKIGEAFVYFIATYDDVSDSWKASIDSSFFVDNEDNISVTNGSSEIYTNRIPIRSDVETIIYITSDKYETDSRYPPTLEVYEDSDTVNALCKELLTTTLGNRLTTLWKNSFVAYNELKYKVATDDEYLLYKDNVFYGDVVLEDGTVITSDVDSPYSTKLLHRKGTRVLDPDGNFVYKFRKGDLLLDEAGNPIPDNELGLTYYTDIFLLQYEYKISKIPEYNDYSETVLDFIRNWLKDDLVYLNSKLLEHSLMYYKPNRSVVSVKTFSGTSSHLIRPRITLYVDTNLYNVTTTEEETSKIGKIIHKHISKTTFKLSEIKDEIKVSLGSGVDGVDIFDIGEGSPDIVTYKSTDNRFAIKKKITKSGSVEYDIEINIIQTNQ